MSSKHTPGPWIAVGVWVEHPDDSIPDICTCDPEDMGQKGRSDKEIRANARLIAAAPELLKALEFFLKWGRCQKAEDMAREAIAKAIG